MRLTSIEFSFHYPYKIYRDRPRIGSPWESQGRTQGEPKCALDSLDVAKRLHPQRHTGVTLVR